MALGSMNPLGDNAGSAPPPPDRKAENPSRTRDKLAGAFAIPTVTAALMTACVNNGGTTDTDIEKPAETRTIQQDLTPEQIFERTRNMPAASVIEYLQQFGNIYHAGLSNDGSQIEVVLRNSNFQFSIFKCQANHSAENVDESICEDAEIPEATTITGIEYGLGEDATNAALHNGIFYFNTNTDARIRYGNIDANGHVTDIAFLEVDGSNPQTFYIQKITLDGEPCLLFGLNTIKLLNFETGEVTDTTLRTSDLEDCGAPTSFFTADGGEVYIGSLADPQDPDFCNTAMADDVNHLITTNEYPAEFSVDVGNPQTFVLGDNTDPEAAAPNRRVVFMYRDLISYNLMQTQFAIPREPANQGGDDEPNEEVGVDAGPDGNDEDTNPEEDTMQNNEDGGEGDAENETGMDEDSGNTTNMDGGNEEVGEEAGMDGGNGDGGMDGAADGEGNGDVEGEDIRRDEDTSTPDLPPDPDTSTQPETNDHCITVEEIEGFTVVTAEDVTLKVCNDGTTVQLEGKGVEGENGKVIEVLVDKEGHDDPAMYRFKRVDGEEIIATECGLEDGVYCERRPGLSIRLIEDGHQFQVRDPQGMTPENQVTTSGTATDFEEYTLTPMTFAIKNLEDGTTVFVQWNDGEVLSILPSDQYTVIDRAQRTMTPLIDEDIPGDDVNNVTPDAGPTADTSITPRIDDGNQDQCACYSLNGQPVKNIPGILIIAAVGLAALRKRRKEQKTAA